MKCTTCGAELVPNATFCTNCGTRAPAASTSAGQQTVQLRESEYSDSPTLPQPERPITTFTGGYVSTSLETSSLAVASMVCGLLGLLQILPLIGPIIAVVTGHLARREIANLGGAKSGKGLALAGLILGYATLLLYLIVCIVIVAIIGVAAAAW